jgi:hypothetical protein
LRYRRWLAAIAILLCAAAVFAGLMAYTTLYREQAAWAAAAYLLCGPGVTLGILWLLEDGSRRRP